ncbi:S-adenosylmethionine-dependent methyltransferase [Paracoccidioides brasiliensis Pb18]|uniref:carnosine N-methyltransferase n=1 Tax=Paracoccidioides brasiliensis (strain Pb18) TaxID=502780 RepID=C1G1L5_PARBD|nr:S-adenosylmethionine-dependent methyltransferase [Paracoccidioides brasiliensis Pb18]EEH44466.1 hypothetical protein PADG_00755 [Paracoccidioides brasiliensis Pb18]ODH46706.1 hypothetical protein GX48_07211 [Paracoccidioides brasiliensis]
MERDRTKEENVEAWGGDFDTLADPDERRVLFAALDSFRQYRRSAHLNITHRRRQSFYALPSAHWQMLAKPPFSILDNFNQVDDAIDANAEIADAILSFGLEAFGLPANPDSNDERSNWHDTATASDISKAHSTVKQFYRDWSSEGIMERNACYKPVMNDLEELFGSTPHIRVLVPGAGLGRLVFDLCVAGYCAEGNEISYHQLLASNWVLNHTRKANEYPLYPFALQFSNLKSRKQQLNKVMIPDAHPGSIIASQMEAPDEGRGMGSMSMSAADFVVNYASPAQKDTFHAVATVFFIDTAPNLVRYIEVVWNCLVCGGYWINVGPLLWHWEDRPFKNESSKQISPSISTAKSDKQSEGIGEPGHVELTEEEVIALIQQFGFEFVKTDSEQSWCGYVQDPESMLQNLYRPAHWVARKIADS